MPCLLLLLLLLSLSIPLLFILFLRPVPTDPPQSRHVSFSLVTSDPFPLHRRRSSAPDSTRPDLLVTPKFSRPLRLSLPTRRRSSGSSTLIHLHTSPPSPVQSSPPSQRTRFVNPFTKRTRSSTLSSPTTLNTLSSITSPSPPRRTIVSKFKSIFKSTSPQPSPVIQSKPILKSINVRLCRKPVARTEPYGPPWNAPMPVPDYTLSPTQVIPPSPNTSRKRSLRQSSLPEKTPMSPGQLSPCTFINQLDEKLSLLQQQRINDLILSPQP